MNELHLFAGAGGGILGSQLLGHRTICAVEIEEYPRKVLLQRQREGMLPWFPIWDDIRTFDGKPWNGLVDIVSGGFPCQDISAAGKGNGIEGARSGLWSEMARVVGEVRPKFVFVENSPMLTSRGLYRVLGDFSTLGYDARWCVLGADDTGAPHRRKRIWILAYSNTDLCRCIHKQTEINPAKGTLDAQRESFPALRKDARENVADTYSERGCSRNSGWQDAMDADPSGKKWMQIEKRISWWEIDPAEIFDTHDGDVGQEQIFQKGKVSTSSGSSAEERWPVESRLGRVAHGVARRVDRLKAIGNGQVPAVAAIAFSILSEGLL
ncbi:DNA cytosine methyltransferase [uncultured Sphaerochaeta sp.]|uniref:DNA cytosine methyltransferase n=1 Tax=uncultured Sphaerochaeta sp. TaxID=886478 RepID=UPI002AA93C7B|nr:DNA cytosine methyltransferase [uncultured Sphaerochaeta sp.]